ncbi:uncharacterized protein LOC113520218 isoform X2 [Galleria mellonella]|uniref:Uncharacterized protein LOC113520218 isoform X2 n=1 Tax=Galleria mellonella TaxID=7137 RepID=A0ABM3MS17_GALME|nr:uncharacterized protein LOC113520218 isoform X2 [Galleria mellonella]
MVYRPLQVFKVRSLDVSSSTVRKHYMDYIIKMLSINYENNQRLLNKNIYLPSAIWRCAKKIEMTAAQTCMVAQLYRKNITAVINDLKNDTTKGKLYRSLYDCLRKPPENDKKLQTITRSNDCTCPCVCNQRKRPRLSESPKPYSDENFNNYSGNAGQTLNNHKKQFTIPVVENLHAENPKVALVTNNSAQSLENRSGNILSQESNVSSKPLTRMSVESQDSDELMLQLEKLFQGDTNDDDLFEGTLCDSYDVVSHVDKKRENTLNREKQTVFLKQDTIIENHAAQIKSLDERLESLAGLLVNNDHDNTIQQKPEIAKTKNISSKWLCEEYFLRLKLYELLDQIRDCNRKKYTRIKEKLLILFGDDSDDDSVMSPLDETPDFVISCKERIAPWVVKLLTPFYIKGRIRGKALFKALAKHLIRLIYQCSRYPCEYEVHSFVSDFLENHKMIRCEADFKQFRIENL